MKFSKTLLYGLVLIAFILSFRAYFIFSTTEEERNKGLLESFVITREAPYEYEIYRGGSSFVNYYSDDRFPQSSLIFVLGDLYCRDEFSYTKETYPYRLFRKMNQNGLSVKIFSLCPENLSGNNISFFISKYLPAFLPQEKTYALMAIGLNDHFENLYHLKFPPQNFPAPTEMFVLTANQADGILEYFRWEFLAEKPTWPNDGINGELLAQDFFKLATKFLDSYSTVEKKFSINKTEVISEILAFKEMPAPLLYYWKQISTDSQSTIDQIFEKTVFFTFMLETQNSRYDFFKTIFLKMAHNEMDMTKDMKIAFAHYLPIIPAKEMQLFLKTLKVNHQKNDSNAIFNQLFKLTAKYEQTKTKSQAMFLTQLTKSLELLKTKNISPILLTYPSESPLFPNDRIRQVAKDQNIPLIDIAKQLSSKQIKKSLFFSLRNYLTPRGHEEVSQIIFDYFKKNNIK